MATPRFRLNRTQAKDLEAIRNLGASEVDRIADALVGMPSPPFGSDELREVIKNLGVSPDTAASLVSVCVHFSSLQRQLDLDTEKIVGGVLQAIENLPEQIQWSADEVSKWTSIEPALARLLISDVVSIVSKRLELSYDYSKLWRSGRILTDIRPVFDLEGEEVQGAIISFTMRLYTQDSDGAHSESLAMDEADIKTLIKECERALKKSESARRFIEPLGKPTIVTGKD